MRKIDVNFVVDEDLMEYNIKKEVNTIRRSLISILKKSNPIAISDFLDDISVSLYVDDGVSNYGYKDGRMITLKEEKG